MELKNPETRDFEAPLLRKRRQVYNSTVLSESSTENREQDINEGENDDTKKYEGQLKYVNGSSRDRPVYIEKEYGNSSDKNLRMRVKKYGSVLVLNIEHV